MPTYEFGCTKCGHKFDVFASISQKEKGLEVKCPECSSSNAIQLFNSVNFIKSGEGSSYADFQAACGPGDRAGGCC